MSETNGCPYQTIRVSTKVRFEFDDGRKLDLPLTDTIREWRELADQITTAQGTHDDYLRRLVAILQEQYQVTLTLGEADELNSQLALADMKKKARLNADIAATLTSLRPTPASTSSG